MFYRGAEGKYHDYVTMDYFPLITVIDIKLVLGVLLIYDITDTSSFDKVKEWLTEV